MHLRSLHRNRHIQTQMMKESTTSLTNSSTVVAVGNRSQLLFFASFQPAFPVCCNYNESRDAMKINEPVGASLSNNLKSWNNEISTKSRYTIQIQEQTKPKQNKATVFEERKTQTAQVPFNNIQSAIFSVPVCYSERSSKYLERRRRDETSVEQWDVGCVMAFVHLAPPALCSVCCVASASPVGPLLVLRPGGVSTSFPRSTLSHTCSIVHIFAFRVPTEHILTKRVIGFDACSKVSF